MISTSSKHQFSQEITQISETTSTSTTLPLFHWQFSRFDIPGVSPCVVICIRGHPSPRDAMELVNLPPLSAFWETALSARLFHGVDFDFTCCMFNFETLGMPVLTFDVRKGSSLSHTLFGGRGREMPAVTSIPCRYIGTRESDEHWDWAVAFVGIQ